MNKDSIDVLLDYYIEHMPKTVYLVKNKGRYEEVVKAMDDIKTFIETIEPDAKFEISKDELIGTSVGLEVTCTLLSLTEVDQFCDAIRKADSIDIMPKTNGDLSVIFGFNDVYVPAPPKTKDVNAQE